MTDKKTADNYLNTSKLLSRAAIAVNVQTGEEVKIDNTLKVVYTEMRDEYVFFNNKGQNFFKSWEAIFADIGISSPNTIKKYVRILKQLGLIEFSKGSPTKIIHDITALEGIWKLTNPVRDKFKSEEAKEKRATKKQERMTKKIVKAPEAPIKPSKPHTPPTHTNTPPEAEKPVESSESSKDGIETDESGFPITLEDLVEEVRHEAPKYNKPPHTPMIAIDNVPPF